MSDGDCKCIAPELAFSSAAEGPRVLAAAAAAAAASRTSLLCSASERWRRRRSRVCTSSAKGASASAGTSEVMSSSPSWKAPVIWRKMLAGFSHGEAEVRLMMQVSDYKGPA